MGKVLITGASGNVGKNAAQYAIQTGMSVKVAGRDEGSLRELYGDSAQAVRFDFTDHSSFARALEGVDTVFVVRPPHIGDPKDMKPFIEALQKKGGIRMVCFLSLIGIEHNPVPPHAKIERYIRQSKLPYCFLRPSFFMQNLSGVHAFEIRNFDRIVVPVRQALTSFIDAEDIGALAARVLSEPEKHQNTAYSITGPEAVGYRKIARILTKVTGRKIIYADPSPKLAKEYWIHVRGLDKEYANVMSMLYMMTRLGTAKTVTDTYEKIMGRKPTSFEVFAKKNRESWC